MRCSSLPEAGFADGVVMLGDFTKLNCCIPVILGEFLFCCYCRLLCSLKEIKGCRGLRVFLGTSLAPGCRVLPVLALAANVVGIFRLRVGPYRAKSDELLRMAEFLK